MAQELKVYRDPKEGPCWREFYEKSEVDAVLADKDAEIRRLNFNLWSARLEAATAERDDARMARCRYMRDKFKEADK